MIDQQDTRAPGLYETIFAGIDFDTALSLGEKGQLQSALRMLPPELVIYLKQIDKIPGTDPRGVANIRQHTGILVKAEGKVELNDGYFEQSPEMQDLILLHEVGGHGLIDQTLSFLPKHFNLLSSVWENLLRAQPQLMEKALYPSSYPLEAVYAPNPSVTMSKRTDEFIADRMAEWFLQRANNKRPNPLPAAVFDSFTPGEQGLIAVACQKTLMIWQFAQERYKEATFGPLLPDVPPGPNLAKLKERLEGIEEIPGSQAPITDLAGVRELFAKK